MNSVFMQPALQNLIQNMINDEEKDGKLQWLNIQINPYMIWNVVNPSLDLQFEALSNMKKTNGIRLKSFPQKTLFYEMHHKRLENTLNILSWETKFFQNPVHFQLLIQCVLEKRKDWFKPILKRLGPLTPEQEQIWKAERMKNIFYKKENSCD